MNNKCQVAVYYFPNYHVDTRNEKVHGQGWTEWRLVKNAKPRFPGHDQPKVPLWGYEDEADPAVFERKIDVAADHGIDSFIFDWYWYNDGPFLQRGLEEGYLNAKNNDRLKFALMWANHDWIDIHPRKMNVEPRLLYPGEVTPETFRQVMDYVIKKYFRHSSYWKIDGRPYFSIYELYRMIQGLGGIDATLALLNEFREKVRNAGFPGLHLNGVLYGIQLLPGEKTIKNPSELIRKLELDSVTSYVWVHHVHLKDFPQTDYEYVAKKSFEHSRMTMSEYAIPYYPNVTMGWDSSPRAQQTDPYENIGYPFMATIKNNTPAAFKDALKSVKTLLEHQSPSHRIITINSWNEWTEGSYLEPDKRNGVAYLQAIREVFVDSERS